MNFKLFFNEFFEYFFTFQINRIAIFRIESIIFQTNPIYENLVPPHSWSQIERNKFELIFIKFSEYFLLFELIKSQIF